MGRVGPLELLQQIALLSLGLLVVVLWARAVLGFLAFRARRQREREAAEEHAREAGEALSGSVRVVEKIVERQVLVMRCKFCNTVTPVDGSACVECGAKL